MRSSLRRLGVLVVLLAVVSGWAWAGPAAAFPERPVTLIVPWDAGGTTDQTARALAKAAEGPLGQPVVVLNKPGASSTLGIAELAAAKPDGYTVGVMSTSTYLIPARGRAVPYDPLKSFAFVSYYGDNLIGVAVLSGARWKTLRDLVEDARSRPGKIKFGTAGVGTSQHLTTEALAMTTGARFVHVPQKGSAGTMPALLGGHVDFITETSVWAPYVEAGKARLLAVNIPVRSEAYADVPTLKELGYQSMRSIQVLIGPAGLPETVRQRLEAAFRKATADPAFRQTMQRLHMAVVDLPGKDAEAIVRAEMARATPLFERLDREK